MLEIRAARRGRPTVIFYEDQLSQDNYTCPQSLQLRYKADFGWGEYLEMNKFITENLALDLIAFYFCTLLLHTYGAWLQPVRE